MSNSDKRYSILYIVIDTDRLIPVRKMFGYEKLSDNFSVYELACKDLTEVVLYSSVALNWLQEIRNRVGSLYLFSSFRTPTYNENIGGVVNSLHLFGKAFDIKKPANLTIDEFFSIVESVSGYVCGIGKYPTFIHLDNRGSHSRWIEE